METRQAKPSIYVPDQFPKQVGRILTGVQSFPEFAPGKGHPRILHLLPERQGDGGRIIIQNGIAMRYSLAVFLGVTARVLSNDSPGRKEWLENKMASTGVVLLYGSDTRPGRPGRLAIANGVLP